MGKTAKYLVSTMTVSNVSSPCSHGACQHVQFPSWRHWLGYFGGNASAMTATVAATATPSTTNLPSARVVLKHWTMLAYKYR